MPKFKILFEPRDDGACLHVGFELSNLREALARGQIAKVLGEVYGCRPSLDLVETEAPPHKIRMGRSARCRYRSKATAQRLTRVLLFRSLGWAGRELLVRNLCKLTELHNERNVPLLKNSTMESRYGDSQFQRPG